MMTLKHLLIEIKLVNPNTAISAVPWQVRLHLDAYMLTPPMLHLRHRSASYEINRNKNSGCITAEVDNKRGQYAKRCKQLELTGPIHAGRQGVFLLKSVAKVKLGPAQVRSSLPALDQAKTLCT